MAEQSESAEFQNLLMCTELLQREDPFHSTIKAEPNAGKKRVKKITASNNGVKKIRTGYTPAQSPVSKVKSGTVSNKRSHLSIEIVTKTAKPLSSEKRKQSRPRISAEELTIKEIIIVDEQSVVPLNEVSGDMDFEDLVAEDLEICRYLPPAGNIRSASKCAEISRRLRAFEQTLQDIALNGTKAATAGGEDTEHDSDATLSILSDEEAGASRDSTAANPPVDVSMLEAYKIVFDPPVPAVITIPTSILRVNDTNDWQTGTRAVQFLMKNNLERRKNRAHPSRKRTVDGDIREAENETNPSRRNYVSRLFAAIEYKSNQAVSLDCSNYSILQPPDDSRKHHKRQRKTIPDGTTADVESPSQNKDHEFVRITTMTEKLLDPFSREFLANNFQFTDEEQLRKAIRKNSSFKKAWNQILLVTDETLQKELHLVLQEAHDEIQRLNSVRERSLLVTDEKCLLDQDETEKRLATNTEKAKSHVINLFEENRRQYELQRTLDFATCKCDMLAINTRNMRKRTDAPHVRLLEDLTVNLEPKNQNPSASPPQSAQICLNAPQNSFPSVQRRRRNHFNVALREPLDDRDIYEDLANINRILKEMPEREKTSKVMKPVEVIPDINSLMVDGKAFYRNQLVTVNHHEHGRYSGVLLQFSQTDFVVKRTSDGRTERRRYALGLLMDRKITLRRRSAVKNTNTAR